MRRTPLNAAVAGEGARRALSRVSGLRQSETIKTGTACAQLIMHLRPQKRQSASLRPNLRQSILKRHRRAAPGYYVLVDIRLPTYFC